MVTLGHRAVGSRPEQDRQVEALELVVEGIPVRVGQVGGLPVAVAGIGVQCGRDSTDLDDAATQFGDAVLG